MTPKNDPPNDTPAAERDESRVPQTRFSFSQPTQTTEPPPVSPPQLPPFAVRRQAGSAPSRPFTVSEIVGQAAQLLDENFKNVWIEGEIEGFKRHHVSQNCYLALKDKDARIEAMLRRQVAQTLAFALRDGLRVRVRGRLTIYKEQGRFQLYIDEVQLSGEGELLRAFEELKARLHKEGLFDPARKRPLPGFPKVVGVATSQSGAALQDILKVAARRGPVHILVAHCAVQGPQAPAQIAEAIERLAPHVDVLIVGRGGGSVADLFCFNDERVARAIFRCPVPVVSAVGHEVDFTIADFVADVRAPTPSAAAELCVPEFARLTRQLSDLSARLHQAGLRLVDAAQQKLDALFGRAPLALSRQLACQRRALGELHARLLAQHPKTQLAQNESALGLLHNRLNESVRREFSRRQTALQAAVGPDCQRLTRAATGLLQNKRQVLLKEVGKLEALSPLGVLLRGYAVVKDPRGHVVTGANQVTVGETVRVLLSHDELICRVTDKTEVSGR